MADGPEVKLSADTGGAQSSFQDAQGSIANSLAGIQKALEAFNSSGQKASEAAIKNNADLSRSFMELRASATSGFDAITGVIERFRGVLGTLTAALAGGLIGKEAVSSLVEMRDAVHGLQIVFGTTADEATKMAVNLKLAGVSAETFEQMAFRVGRVLRTQSDEFDRLGVSVKDSNGNLLPMNDILQNIYQRMLDFKPGADQVEFALSTVGRNAKDFAEDMEKLAATSERTTEVMRDLGIEMGPARQAEVARYKVEVNAFQLALEEIGVRVGEQLLPGLMRLADWFNSIAPSAIAIVVPAIKVFITALEVVRGSVEIVIGAFKVLGVAISEAINVLFRGESISEAWTNIKNATTNALNDIVKQNADAVERINKLWNDAGSGAYGMRDRGIGGEGALPGKGTERFQPKPKGGGPSQLTQWDDALKAAQDYYNDLKDAQGSFERWSEAMTRDYWQEVLASAKLAADDRAAIDHKMHEANNVVRKQEFDAEIANLNAEAAQYKFNYDKRIELAQQAAAKIADKYGQESAQYAAASAKIIEIERQKQAQLDALAELDKKRAEAVANYEYQQKLTGLQQQLALRKINVQQELALEQDYLAQKLAIDVRAVQDQIDAMGPDDDPVKMQKLKDQLLALELDYQNKKTAIDNKAALDRQQYQLQADQAIENSAATLFSDLMGGTKSWKQAMLDAVNSITKALNDLVAKKLAQQLFGAGSSGGGIIDSLMAGLFGGGAGGGGGGIAPFVGGGFDIPSLAVGSAYVPQNTLAFLHKGEAVIPAAYNSRGALGQSVNVTNNFAISGPVNTATQDQIAAATARATQRALYRNL